MSDSPMSDEVVVRPRECAAPIAFAVGAVVLIGVWPLTSSTMVPAEITASSHAVVEPLVIVDPLPTTVSPVDAVPDDVRESDDIVPSYAASSMVPGLAEHVLTTDLRFDLTNERAEVMSGSDNTATAPSISAQPLAPSESSTNAVEPEPDDADGDLAEPGEVLQLVRWVSSPTLVRVPAPGEVRDAVSAAILRIRSSYLDAIANPDDVGRRSLALSDRSGFMRSIASSGLAETSVVDMSKESISIGEIVTVDVDRSIAAVCIVTAASGLVATLESVAPSPVSFTGHLGLIYNGSQWVLDDGNMSISASGC